MGTMTMIGWKTKQPMHRMAETSGAYDGAKVFAGHGLMAGTHVASNLGWRPVEALAAGDKVLTFDNGLQMVLDVRRTVLFADASSVPEHMCPVTVPAGALGNRKAMHVLPEQGVLVESDAANDAHGDPFAIVTAASLVGFRGIAREFQAREIEIVTLYFAQPQVIYAEGGMLIYCPQAHLALTDMISAATQPYDVLTGEDASFLVDCMRYEDKARALGANNMGVHAVA